jgi:hypothetical protein
MVHVAIPGFRVQELVIVTTLTDEKRYPKGLQPPLRATACCAACL